MSLEKIRKIARSRHWQGIYSASQKCSGVHLFENMSNFSGLQSLFLHWLRVYSMLYEELSQNEWPNLDEAVINTDWRCDAFLYWRSKNIEKKIKQHKAEMNRSSAKNKSLPIYQGKKGKK